MFALLRRLAMVGGIAAFVRSPTGQNLVAKAKTMANDPKTRQKISDLVSKAKGGRTTSGPVLPATQRANGAYAPTSTPAPTTPGTGF